MPPPPLHPTSTAVTHHPSHTPATGLETPPPSRPSSQPAPTKHKPTTPATPKPRQYTLSDGPRNAPGTAAYYKSWAFRSKVYNGRVSVSGQEGGGGGDDDSVDESYNVEEVNDKQTKDGSTRRRLVMILSRTTARRAAAGRKVDRRMKCANRRVKFLRKLEGVECLFEWD